jgi:predicted transposase YbfD/YdcC
VSIDWFWRQRKCVPESNEITAIPVLLELLDLSGCIVTLDAMGTQKSIARQIHDANADYILSLKSNHPTLFQQVEQWFQHAQAAGTLPTPCEHTTATGHHRIDTLTVWTLPVDTFATLHQADAWVGLQSIVIVERTRRLWNKTTHEVQFYLSSLPPESPQIATAIRQHWGIENGLHWTSGCHMTVKMLVGCFRSTRHTICLCYAALLSMHSIASRANRVSGRSPSEQQWMITSCCGYCSSIARLQPRRQTPLSIAFEMRLPCL